MNFTEVWFSNCVNDLTGSHCILLEAMVSCLVRVLAFIYLFFLPKQVQCILQSDIFITTRILQLLLLQYIAWVNLLYVSFISSFPWRLNGSQQICYDPSRMLRVYETATDNQTRPSIDVACWFTLGLWAMLSLGLMFAQPLSDFITFRKHFINTLSSAIVGSRKANKPWFYPPCYCLWSDNHQCSQNSERCQKLKLGYVFFKNSKSSNFDLTSAWNAHQAGLEEEGDLLFSVQ